MNEDRLQKAIEALKEVPQDDLAGMDWQLASHQISIEKMISECEKKSCHKQAHIARLYYHSMQALRDVIRAITDE